MIMISFIYALQVGSVLLQSVIGLRMLWQQRCFQHAEWHQKATHLFLVYCTCEFFRVADCFYPDLAGGIIYSFWGAFPWCVHIYSWVVRDICMFRGMCVYLEHALIWSHTCMGWQVPRGLLKMQQICSAFGNIVFLVVGQCFLLQNDQFWQPVAALAQIPPNIAITISCCYLYRCLQKVPDSCESRRTVTVNQALLVAAFSVVCVFIPWGVPTALDLYSKKISVHPTIPNGASILFATAPSVWGVDDGQLDITVSLVELSVGWCGCVGLWLVRGTCVPPAGEPLVLTSEEVGQTVAKTASKKHL